METLKPYTSTSPSSNGASWRLVWRQRFLWLISALSGTLEIEAEIESLRLDRERMRLENEKLDEIILQTRNEIKQDRERMRLENEKLDEIILQTRNETKQDRERMRLENEKLDEIILQTRNETKRLSELESKLDGLFSKYNINLGAPTKPQQ
ncbi:MAG: hypothetical protein LVT47_10830 [Cyanobacteria bacterium LVE1205-1]